MTTKTERTTVGGIVVPSRIVRVIRMKRSLYIGVCIVQAKGGWSRLGPTWRTAIGFVVVGRGINSWGTTLGLAQLCVDTSCSPSWHAAAVAVAPEPNLVLAVAPELVEHYGEEEADQDAALL